MKINELKLKEDVLVVLRNEDEVVVADDFCNIIESQWGVYEVKKYIKINNNVHVIHI